MVCWLEHPLAGTDIVRPDFQHAITAFRFALNCNCLSKCDLIRISGFICSEKLPTTNRWGLIECRFQKALSGGHYLYGKGWVIHCCSFFFIPPKIQGSTPQMWRNSGSRLETAAILNRKPRSYHVLAIGADGERPVRTCNGGVIIRTQWFTNESIIWWIFYEWTAKTNGVAVIRQNFDKPIAQRWTQPLAAWYTQICGI